MIKKNKGITLVALVVTIIVLIILAGVSINLVFGQDGIIKKSKSGSTAYSVASTREQIEIELANIYAENTNGVVTFDIISKRLTEKEMIKEVLSNTSPYQVKTKEDYVVTLIDKENSKWVVGTIEATDGSILYEAEYTAPKNHVHTADCIEYKTHTHDESCYSDGDCEITMTTRTLGAGIELCLNADHFEFTNIGKVEARIHHSSCGKEDEVVTKDKVCYKCYSDSHNQTTFNEYFKDKVNITHNKTLICGKEDGEQEIIYICGE